MDAAGTSAGAVGPQELADADQKFHQALALRATDPEQAVELLGEVLAVRNRRYGENAFECASAYFHYGQALFEQAQAATDVLGEPLRRAAQQRAEAQAADEGGEGEDEEEEEESSEEGDGDEQQGDAEADGAAGQQQGGAAAMAQDGQQQQQQQRAADKGKGPATAASDASEGDEQGSEGEEDDEEGDGGDDQEGGAANGDLADDMALAWEMLELARLLYERADGSSSSIEAPAAAATAAAAGPSGDAAAAGPAAPAAAATAAHPYASELADIHLTLGDIACEQEDFEGGAAEYRNCLNRLGTLNPAPERRLAEAHYKLALALQFLEQPAEALRSVGIARARLQARVAQLRGGCSSSAPGDAAPALGSSASVDASGASAADASAPVADIPDDVASRAREVDSIRLVLGDLDDKAEELRAIVAEHESMKGMIMSALRAAAGADEPPEGLGGAGSGSGAGPMEAEGAGGSAAGAGAVAAPAAAVAAAAPVRDLGVVGGGRRMAPVPVAAPAAAAAAAAGPAGPAGPAAAGDSAEAMAVTPPVAKGGASKGKRSLGDLMAGGAATGAAGAATTVGFGGASRGNVPDAMITTPEMKRLRLVSPAPAVKTNGVENEQQQQQQQPAQQQ